MPYDHLRDALDAAGIRVRAVNGKLRITHASRLTPALRDALRLHKDRILAECVLPLWAQVYIAFGGGDVYEGRCKLRPKRIAREMARLTQRGLDIPPCSTSSESEGAQESILPPPPHPMQRGVAWEEVLTSRGGRAEGVLNRHVRSTL